MSFKMGAKFAVSFYMGKNIFDIWYVFVCLSTRSELVSVKIDEIKKRYRIINVIHRLLF